MSMRLRSMRFRMKIAALVVSVGLLGVGVAAAQMYPILGAPHTTYGWKLTPAGIQSNLGDFPMGGSLSPDGRYLIVTNDGQGTQSLQVVDLTTSQVVQTLPYPAPEALYLGLAFAPDGKTLYAAAGGNNKIRVYSFGHGLLTEQAPIAMNGKNYYPGGLAVSGDGKALYVANNLDNSLSKIDTATGTITTTTPVGKNPYGVALSHDGSTVYVTNSGESSVSVLDAGSLQVRATVPVGLHPNALAVNPASGDVYVCDSDSDQVSVIARGNRVVRTLSLLPYRQAPTGSQPDALAFNADGTILYVANAGDNDIAVFDLRKPDQSASRGLIPTAWYPTGVIPSADGQHLLVLNGKGLGSGPNPGYIQGTYGPPDQYVGSMMVGTLSTIAVPNQGQLAHYTSQVRDNDRFLRDQGVAAARLPIKHVIYVIKENRTYDQVFGDVSKGNGDPSLTEFGATVTPNLHRLVQQFALFDNFYADADISAQGHNWTTAAMSNDYVEKNWMANYSGRNRGYDFEGTNTATYPLAGFLWNDAMRAGVSFRDYGEFASYDAASGKWVADDPSIGGNIDPNFPGWNLQISDLTRFDAWKQEFDQYVQNGNLPALEIMRLPNDHTSGTTPGMPTPQAMVAQNDQAMGDLVDAVSHSPYWKDTAIFITEDDAQDGPDHVDAHRTETLVVSPYTQRGIVDHTYYDTAAMVRTIELLLGLKPMTQFDAAATPMFPAFTNKPQLAAYDAVPEQVSLSTLNTASSPMAAESANMDFSVEDRAPMDQLNRAIWAATKGKVPYPKPKGKPSGDGGN